jgi:hypothetical protein
VVVVPAYLWRLGPVLRATTLGLIAGIVLSALSFADSGLWLSSVAVLVILPPFYAILMGRRMRRFWPGANGLSGADRVAVARAARRGEKIADARLAPAVIDYSDGLRAAYEIALPRRWSLAAAQRGGLVAVRRIPWRGAVVVAETASAPGR